MDNPVTLQGMALDARESGVDVRDGEFRRCLNAARFSWHDGRRPWVVEHGSQEHKDMMMVMDSIIMWRGKHKQ